MKCLFSPAGHGIQQQYAETKASDLSAAASGYANPPA
jgi:hypothetical protein